MHYPVAPGSWVLGRVGAGGLLDEGDAALFGAQGRRGGAPGGGRGGGHRGGAKAAPQDGLGGEAREDGDRCSQSTSSLENKQPKNLFTNEGGKQQPPPPPHRKQHNCFIYKEINII